MKTGNYGVGWTVRTVGVGLYNRYQKLSLKALPKWARVRDGRSDPDLGDRGVGVALLEARAAQLTGRVRGEVAVATARRAERHVHVDPERVAAELAPGSEGKGAVGRGRDAVRESGGHGETVFHPAAP